MFVMWPEILSFKVQWTKIWTTKCYVKLTFPNPCPSSPKLFLYLLYWLCSSYFVAQFHITCTIFPCRAKMSVHYMLAQQATWTVAETVGRRWADFSPETLWESSKRLLYPWQFETKSKKGTNDAEITLSTKINHKTALYIYSFVACKENLEWENFKCRQVICFNYWKASTFSIAKALKSNLCIQ